MLKYIETTGKTEDAAIEAALYPAETDYYFFFTDADWNYYYNNDYSTHQKMYNEIVKNK